MSAKPVDILAVLADEQISVLALKSLVHPSKVGEMEERAANISAARAFAANLIAENTRLRQRSMQASGFGALLSSILGAGVLREHPDLRERVKRAVADNEAHMAKVLSGGGQ
jgi:hypothetical protein